MFLELNSGWEPNCQVDTIPFYLFTTSISNLQMENVRHFQYLHFKTFTKFKESPIGMFTICISCPKDLKHSDIPILEMKKPFGTSGTHFPTFVFEYWYILLACSLLLHC